MRFITVNNFIAHLLSLITKNLHLCLDYLHNVY